MSGKQRPGTGEPLSQQRITRRVVAKYALLQLPALIFLVLILLGLRQWLAIPPWLFWTVVAAWAAKDALLFPLVWRAYDPDAPHPANPLTGARGVARERLDPSGYIRVRGELWRAELEEEEPAVEKGETVLVREVRGLTLLVTREREGGEGRQD
jgi:membrane protein implicated in regulation of membrane protease activity